MDEEVEPRPDFDRVLKVEEEEGGYGVGEGNLGEDDAEDVVDALKWAGGLAVGGEGEGAEVTAEVCG